MSSTDDDLKRLKESLSGELPEFSTWAQSDLRVLRSLLARLEAAEDFMFADQDSYDEKLERWRKAAGKK